jgi:hypothetical protein
MTKSVIRYKPPELQLHPNSRESYIHVNWFFVIVDMNEKLA